MACCPPLRLRNGTTVDDPLGAALTFVEKDGSYQPCDLATMALDGYLTVSDIRVANRIIAPCHVRSGQGSLSLAYSR